MHRIEKKVWEAFRLLLTRAVWASNLTSPGETLCLSSL